MELSGGLSPWRKTAESFFFAVMHEPQNRSSTSHGKVESTSIGSRIDRWMECETAYGEEETSTSERQKRKLEDAILCGMGVTSAAGARSQHASSSIALQWRSSNTKQVNNAAAHVLHIFSPVSGTAASACDQPAAPRLPAEGVLEERRAGN